MAMTDDEQGRLKEIEFHERAIDPGFVTRLDLPAVVAHDRRLRRLCRWLLTVGAWMTFIGFVAARGPISIGTLVAGCGCALMAWSAVTGRMWRSAKDAPPRSVDGGRPS